MFRTPLESYKLQYIFWTLHSYTIYYKLALIVVAQQYR
jgi:hypothetical protein